MKSNPNNFPSIDEINKTIKQLKEINLAKISYSKLWHILETQFKLIPFVTAKLKKGYYVERARINNNNELFITENEISYKEDSSQVVQFGRANPPFQSMFYGAVANPDIKYPRIVNLLEISEIFRNMPKNKLVDTNFNITSGKWLIKGDFELIDIIHNNSHNNKAFDTRRKEMYQKHPDKAERMELILDFFSKEFTKKGILNHHDYKISTIYTQMGFQKGLNGVTYPSVRTQGLGQNIAITPGAVEKYLNLETVALFQVTKQKDKTVIDNLKYSTDLGIFNTSFKWIDIA